MNKVWKTILVIIGLILLALIYYFFFYSGKIELQATPGEAVMTILGKNLTGTSFQLNPGKYSIKISAPGYIDTEREITLRGGERKKIKVSLKEIPSPILLARGVGKFYPDLTPGQVLYFSDKTIYRAAGKKIVALTPNNLEDIQDIIFSPDTQLAILKKTGGETGLYDFARYDFIAQEYHSWGKEIGEIVWRPDGEKVFYYLETKKGERSLIRANKNNSELERIFNLKEAGIENPSLSISSDGEKILLQDGGNLYLFQVYPKKLTKLAQGVIWANFSPRAKEVAILDQEKNLFLLENGDKKDLGLRTEIGKIAWTNQGEIIIFSEGKLFKLDPKTRQKKDLLYKSLPPSIDNLILSKGDKLLFFLSRNNLYSLELF